MKTCIIFGAGGHAKMVIELIRLIGNISIAGLIDNDINKHGTQVMGCTVIGSDADLTEIAKEVDYFVLGIGGIGNPKIRKIVYNIAKDHHLKPLTLVHPSAIVSSYATLGEGCQIMPNAIINVDAVLGDNVLINTGAVVEHESFVGAHTHIASKACLLGNVTVGEETLIGGNSTIRQGLTIGSLAVVGMGSVVTKNVPDACTVVGVPARKIKEN
ncbi:MAG: acetyltransferase [Phototrophicaceae bacterium]